MLDGYKGKLLNLIILTKINLEHNTKKKFLIQKRYKNDIQNMEVTDNSSKWLKDLAKDNMRRATELYNRQHKADKRS